MKAEFTLPDFDEEKLKRRIFDACHLTGVFKLRSGMISNEYFDKYMFESDPDLLREIATAFHVKFGGTNLIKPFDGYAALETGGIPIAVAIGQYLAYYGMLFTGYPASHFIVFVRKKAKEYGTAKLCEGPTVFGARLVVVEDVVTTGGQVVESIAELRRLGAIVDDAICVIDRQAGGQENLLDIGVNLHSLFKKSDFDGMKKSWMLE